MKHQVGHMERQQRPDGTVVLTSPHASVRIQKISGSVLLLVINSATAQEVRDILFEEIRVQFNAGDKLNLFFDLRNAMSSTVAVDIWSKFFIENIGYISHINILAGSKANYLTCTIIEHFVRTKELFQIFEDLPAYAIALYIALQND